MRRIGITGIGAVTPFGRGVDAFEEGLRQGWSGISPALGVFTDDLRSSKVGEVDDDLLTDSPFDPDVERCLALAVLAAEEALRRGNALEITSEIAYLAFGSDNGEVRAVERLVGAGIQGLTGSDSLPTPASVNQMLAHTLGLESRCLSFVNACAASATGLATCVDLIRLGEVDMALAGGAEILNRATLAGFNALHALAPQLCRPFDVAREGTQLGEVGAYLLLEDVDHARTRGQPVLAEISGCGMSSDAFHPTRSDPDGLGPQEAMKRALRDSNLSPEDIDYINAHGTGTFQNDLIELLAIREVFGERSPTIPISSTKSQIGHGAAACGAVESVACVLALQKRFLPPTLNLERPPPDFEAYDFVAEPGRSADIRHVMTNSLAFGGFNVSLILSSDEK